MKNIHLMMFLHTQRILSEKKNDLYQTLLDETIVVLYLFLLCLYKLVFFFKVNTFISYFVSFSPVICTF